MKCMRRQLPIVFTVACFSVLAFLSKDPAPAFAQAVSEGPSAVDVLRDLEQRAGLQPPPYVSVVQRIAVLEQKYFGTERPGSVVQRLESLKLAASGTAIQSIPADQVHTCSLHTLSLGDALPLVSGQPPNYVRVDAPGFPVAANDYYGDVFKSSQQKVVRFKSMPITVYITPYPDAGFMHCVRRSFDTWEAVSDGLVKFTEVQSAKDARIQVVWKRLGQRGDIVGCTLGAQTIMKYKDRGNGNLSFVGVSGVPVPVYIPRFGPKYVVPPQVIEVNLDLIMSRDPTKRYRLLENISTHELGHALGLLGHSPFKADMMNEITDEHSRVSQRDVNTLIQLYSKKCDVPL